MNDTTPETEGDSESGAAPRKIRSIATPEQRELIRSALVAEAGSIARSCYVDLVAETRAQLREDLDPTELATAQAAIAELADAQRRYSALENDILLDRYVWDRTPEAPAIASANRVFRGESNIVEAGNLRLHYVLDDDAYPELARARAHWTAARKVIATFLKD